MLAAEHRLRSSQDFRDTVRRGRRTSRPLLTLHLLPPDVDERRKGPARAGLVVGKSVGGSVVRSRTSRQLRHLLRNRIHDLPPGARLVVRATAAAAGVPSAQLARDLDSALAAVRRPREPR